jgi:predicted dehydrogenase
MASSLRVGLIGANVGYGWSPRAHLPALLALPDLELVAVCTSHADTARESAARFGAPMAFDNHLEMLARADLDVVGVSVRVPLHHRLTMDVLEAGKHVYTEWPLGASLQEAEEMADLARRKGVQTMVGLQGRCSPYYLRLEELIGEGYVGEVLAANMTSFGSGVLSRTSDRTWQSDRTLGATTMTIAFGHIVDTLCMCLGEFAEVSAVVETRVPRWHETDTGRMVDVTAPDNVLVSGVLASGALVSAHVSSVPWHGRGYRLQIYGREGTLIIEAQQHPHLETMRILGAKEGEPELKELPIPRRLTWVPDAVPQGPPFNVAQMWSRLANAIRTGERAEPDFDTAVTRHRLLDAIQRASDTGKRQGL